MFSELPQLADIVRSAFDHLENPLVLGSRRSGSEPFWVEL